MESIVGKILCDRYRIIQELSQDDFSTTYLAEDMRQAGNPQCQIERLFPQYDSEVLGTKSWQKVLRAFVEQGNILKNISRHPQIPQLLAFFESDREFFLVQELINGISLQQKLTESLLNESEALSWLQEILEVLDFIHKAGVVHLNIQPSSLVQQPNGQKFLTNFAGIKNYILFSSQSKKTISNRYFSSLEQQEENPKFADDIYALGKTIIYGLTGNITEFIRSESWQPKDTINSSTSSSGSIAKISPELADVLNKMVSSRKAYLEGSSTTRLYQSAAEILAELDFSQQVVTLPPPFFDSSQVAKTRLIKTKTPSNPTTAKSRTKSNKGIIWTLLTFPFIVALVIIFIGINKNTYKGFVNYDNDDYQFSIKYPQYWSLQELDDPITGGVVVFTSPLESSADSFLEKVYIAVEYLSSEPTTLEEYTQIVFERINQEQGNEIEVYQDRKTKIGEFPAHMVVYSRQEGGLQLRQMETFTIKNNQVYIIIYTAERAKFSKFLDTAEKMIDSWEIQ